jgi:hypothetical protein
MLDDKIEAVSNRNHLEADFSYPLPPGTIDFMFSNQKVYFLSKSKLMIGAYQKQN